MNAKKYWFGFNAWSVKVSPLFYFLFLLAIGGGAFICMANRISAEGDDVKLEVAAPRIIGFGHIFVASSSSTPSPALPPLTLPKQEIDPSEYLNLIYGSGRPGGEGLTIIEGIGLGGATAITFEGTGVTGIVEYSGAERHMNPPVVVYVRIAPDAELGPRAFSLLTPRGEVHSGNIVFTVREPEAVSIFDDKAAPGAIGHVSIVGVGLDQTQDIRFDGEGITVRDYLVRGPSLINPSLSLTIEVSPTAPLGPRGFSVVTSHGVVRSSVTFSVTNPHITGISDGSFSSNPSLVEVAPGTTGIIQIYGVGLCDVSAIYFSGTGVTGRVFSTLCNRRGDQVINLPIQASVTIAPDAPLGPRTFSLARRRSGIISSADAGVTFVVTPPHIDRVFENEAAPGSQGSISIYGVGLRGATEIRFIGGEGIAGQVRPSNPNVLDWLNNGITATVSVSSTAPLGPRRFSLVLPNGVVESGDLTFTVSSPRISSIDSTNGSWHRPDEPPSAVVPGTSGLIRIRGIGLGHVIGVRISGEGVTARLESPARQGETFNQHILVRVNVSPDAPLGPRTLELELASGRKSSLYQAPNEALVLPLTHTSSPKKGPT